MSHNNALSVLLLVYCFNSVAISHAVNPKKPLESHMIGGYKDFQMNVNESKFYCNQFENDYDILRQMPFLIHVNPESEYAQYIESIADMDENNIFVTRLTIIREKFVPSSVFCLSNLQMLHIDETPFVDGIVPDAFGDLKRLEDLSIHESPIVKMTERLGMMENVDYLVLYKCSLTSLPDLSRLHKLRLLLVEDNNLSHINGISDLTMLDIRRNLFKEIPMLKNGKKLVFLGAGSNPLKNALPILQYENLKVLDLENTTITSIPANIDKLQSLEFIDVSMNRLTHLPTNLLNLPHLEVLNISSNFLAPDHVQSIQTAFKKSRPQVQLFV